MNTLTSMTADTEVALAFLSDAAQQVLDAYKSNDPDVDHYIDYLRRAITYYEVVKKREAA